MKTHYYMILMACALIGFASCSDNKKVETAEDEHHQHTEDVVLTKRQMQTVGIALGQPETRSMGSAVRASGQLCLNPQDKAEVTSLIGGIVSKICVVEGQQVRAGQTVAYVENTDIVELQKDYLIAVNEARVAAQELARQKTLARQGAGVGKTLQQAEAASEIAKARQTGLSHQLRQLGISTARAAAGQIVAAVPITTPIGGTVSRISVSTGSNVAAAGALMQVADNSAVYASVNVFERDIRQVSIGQEVDLSLTNSPGTRLKGTVKHINRTLDSQTKAIAVHVALAGRPATTLIAGMSLTAYLHTSRQKVSALPDDAIVSADGKKYVFVLTDNAKGASKAADTLHFRRAEVATGVSEQGYTQTTFVGTVPATATVVTKGAFYLASMTADHGEH